MDTFTFTSESVTEGHPDKMADAISDSILDAMLAQDPMSRVACETFVTTGLCIVGGEITTNGYVDIAGVVRETICGIGYDKESYGYDGHTVGVMVALDEQSPDIAQGVDDSEEVRSGKSGEDELNKQEQGYLAALESARSFEQAGSEMTLLNSKGQMAVTLQRAG